MRSARNLSVTRKLARPSSASQRIIARCHSTSTNKNHCTKYTTVTHPDGAVSPSARTSNLLPVFARAPLTFSHGKGSWVYTLPSETGSTTEGRKYLDFTAGIAVNALGHADEAFAKAMFDQANQLVHTSNAFWNPWTGALADLLVEQTKVHGGLGWEAGGTSTTSTEEGAKIFFTNSGTEANEGAFKFGRKIGKEVWSQRVNGRPWDVKTDASSSSTACPKHRIVCFQNAFHGRTFGAVSATPNPKYQKPFEPLVPGFDVGVYNDMEGVEGLVGEDTCAVIVEPIQGEGGLAVANMCWLRALRRRCDEVGAVLIFDEIQCGLYRTGTLWAHSSYDTDCHPDIVTMAKPLANGYPVGAIMMKDKLGPLIETGSHGTTFGGSPMAGRLGHHVLERMSSPSFLTHVHTACAHMHRRLSSLPTAFPSILQPASVRGRGLLVGLGFKDAEDPGRLVKMMRERGVLILTAGKDAVRIVPSLVVEEEEIDLACDVLESCLGVLESEKRR